MKQFPLKSWKVGNVVNWLRSEGLSSLVQSFMRARIDGRTLEEWPFSRLQKSLSGDVKEMAILPGAYSRLMRQHKVAWRFSNDEARSLETQGLPTAFRSSGSAVACLELGALKTVEPSDRSIPKNEAAVPGERSQWDFEHDFWELSKVNADAMFDVPWETFPFWRVGVEVRRILMRANFGISVLSRLAEHYNEDIQRMEVSRDLLPLPLPLLSDEDDVDRAISDFEDEDFVANGSSLSQWWWFGSESWMFVIIALLNFLHTGKDTRLSDLGVCKDKMSHVQQLAYMRMYNQVQHSIALPAAEEFLEKDHSWDKVLSTLELDYSGQEVHPAQMMTWEQVRSALPQPGKAGAVRLLDLCEGMMAEVICNPEILVKPKSEWKLPKSTPKMQWADDDEWRKIVIGCAELGVFRFLKPDELLYVDGLPVRHNCLGVGKGKWLQNGLEKQRMVFNLDLTNSMLRLIIGDIRSLSYPGQWQAVQMLDPIVEDEHEFVFAHSSTDLTCAYYCFRMERAWDKYLAFEDPVKGSDVAHVFPELKDVPSVYACSAVLPMGFNSASSIMQYVHVRMATMCRPRGAELSVVRQMRCDRPLPHDAKDVAMSDLLWEVFQDNFDEAERIEIQSVFDLIGSKAPELADMQDTYLVWGASRAEDKTFDRVLVCESLGFKRDGLAGIQMGTDKATSSLIGLTTHVMKQREVTLKTLQVVGGRWCRHVQLRRELGCCLDGLWRVIGQYVRKLSQHRGRKWIEKIPVTVAMREDLFMLICALPLMIMDLRLRTDPVVTASDASEEGCGVCRSVYLQPVGIKALRSLKEHEAPLNGNIGLVEIFAGISGARQALCLAGINPGVHVLIDTNHGSVRASKMAWPRAISWSDARSVTLEMVRSLLQVALHVDLWIVTGAFPCLEYTALKAERGGHAKDFLVQEVARIALLFIQVFPKARVKRMYENVTSMSDDECKWITESITDPSLGLDPLILFRLNGSDFTPHSRDRLFWLDLDPSFLAQFDCEVEESDFNYGNTMQSHMYQVTVECAHPPSSSWLNAGSRLMNENVILPTFVKSMKRRKPPVKPAGIEQCDDDAIARWKADEYRYPPYQYLEKYLVLNRDGKLVTVDSDERERLSMYPVGMTREVCTAKERANKVNFEDARLSAIGEGFHCGAVGWLLNKALVYWKADTHFATAQSIVDEYFAQPLLDRALLPESKFSNELSMTRALVAYQSHVGGEVRSMPTRQFSGNTWPRHGIPAEWWKWSTVLSFPWAEVESINMLEARALLHSLRWRARSQFFVGSRCVHLLDSQVCLGALRKWRSPSPAFNRVITRIASVIIASSCKVIFIYVPTEFNPADKPSRKFPPWSSHRVRED